MRLGLLAIKAVNGYRKRAHNLRCRKLRQSFENRRKARAVRGAFWRRPAAWQARAWLGVKRNEKIVN